MNAILLAVQKRVTDKLVDPVTIFHITEHLTACFVGLPTDMVSLEPRLRMATADFRRKSGFEIPIAILASYLSEIHENESQYVSIRPTAVSAILFGCDPPTRTSPCIASSPTATPEDIERSALASRKSRRRVLSR
jgi:20S proteasome subunit alpha 1